MRKNKDLFSIFPADAGVNLYGLAIGNHSINIPRGCGGEPHSGILRFLNDCIFPADAGVNPGREWIFVTYLYIPRGCGGEP